MAGVLKPSMLSFSLGTRFGHALVVRLLLAGAFAVLVALGLRGAVDRRLRWALAACALGLVLTWTLVDHSRTGVQTWLGVPAASVHLLAMALWLGGLTLLLFAVLDRGDASLPVAVGRFSRLALICFVALGVTGVYLTYRQSGSAAGDPEHGLRAAAAGQERDRAGDRRAGPLLAAGRSARGAPGSIRAHGGRGGDPRRRRAGRHRRARQRRARPGQLRAAVRRHCVRSRRRRPARGGHVQVHMEPAKEGQNVTDVYLVQRGGAARRRAGDHCAAWSRRAPASGALRCR